MARKHQNGGVIAQVRNYSGGGNQTGVYDMQTVYDHFSGAPTNREGYNRGQGTSFSSDIKFFARGAGGGGGSNYSGGANGLGGSGGLAEGTLLGVPAGTTLYVMVGEGGGVGPGGTAYGGGAQPGNGSFYGGVGGGATSVQLSNTELKNLFGTQTDVIIVAGGGGGGGNTSYGGSGGGATGLSANATGVQFQGRTGGAGGSATPSSSFFGQGQFTSQNLAGGGGGGWGGGGGGANSTGGGGGSGYTGFAGSGAALLPALTSVSMTDGGGSAGGLGQQTLTGNNPGSPGTDGELEVWKDGSFWQTLSYTGAMQSLVI